MSPLWRTAPVSGEHFESIVECERRVRGFAFVEGFELVRNGGGDGEDECGIRASGATTISKHQDTESDGEVYTDDNDEGQSEYSGKYLLIARAHPKGPYSSSHFSALFDGRD